MPVDRSEPDPGAERTGGGPAGPSGRVGAPVVVLDVANIMGSRPDGWWRDRAGAAGRVLAGAVHVLGAGGAIAVLAVLEGRSRTAAVPPAPGLEVVLAPGEGDDTIVEVALRCLARPGTRAGGPGAPAVVVVTADRGLRRRLPGPVEPVGPRWWFDLVDGAGT